MHKSYNINARINRLKYSIEQPILTHFTLLTLKVIPHFSLSISFWKSLAYSAAISPSLYCESNNFLSDQLTRLSIIFLFAICECELKYATTAVLNRANGLGPLIEDALLLPGGTADAPGELDFCSWSCLLCQSLAN